MKILYTVLLFALCTQNFAQTAGPAGKKTKRAKSNINTGEAVTEPAKPRVTATERYLKGSAIKSRDADATDLKDTGVKSPFVGGVHAASNAGEKFDTITPAPNANNAVRANLTATPVAAPNDTVFNTNTITNNGITTNSGAVDRSGQAQFGQTNWGNSRSTIGESQWTIPPPVAASFNREFPTAGNLTWSKNKADTSIYSARYKSGDSWVTANYNTSGQRLETRTEVPLTLLPKAVSSYIDKIPRNLPVATITKWEVLGKTDVYEIQTKTGKTIYVNDAGTEVNR